jgi:hypothetical protein
MNKIRFIVFINIINNHFIYIKMCFTTLYKNYHFIYIKSCYTTLYKNNLNSEIFLSGSIQRIFTLRRFIIMSDINDKCNQKMINTPTLQFRTLNYHLRHFWLYLRHAKCRYSLNRNLSYFYLRLYFLYILKAFCGLFSASSRSLSLPFRCFTIRH